MWAPAFHYSVDLQIQTYTEQVALKYGKLATKYPWIYGSFYSVVYTVGYTKLLITQSTFARWPLDFVA